MTVEKEKSKIYLPFLGVGLLMMNFVIINNHQFGSPYSSL